MESVNSDIQLCGYASKMALGFQVGTRSMEFQILVLQGPGATAVSSNHYSHTNPTHPGRAGMGLAEIFKNSNSYDDKVMPSKYESTVLNFTMCLGEARTTLRP
ncbi:hypothetical protein H920_10665 [Fukomys damarensis]|uniref:Uncharacterized protein n=1 Tax=Fukomys damarensis TaxID=885580 RepID=A0A091D785_FUKDA|nr:hypothetical protein H920_10665 [Fukomys damarensis]